MNADSTPRAVVLAGINGAGKTTSSRSLLAEELSLMTFVNADVIAQGLSGFDPDSAAIEASCVMLERLHALAAKRADFALETTLAARTYVSWLKTLRESGYDVRLVYFWLKSADLAVSRVAARVRAGGHNIPESTIRRRYGRSVHNLLALYIPVVSKWDVYDNSGDEPRPIANGSHGRIDRISDSDTWARLTGHKRMAEPTSIANQDRITAALARGVREALLTHAQMGRSVPQQPGDQVVRVTPAEIFARYGLDENGRPKS